MTAIKSLVRLLSLASVLVAGLPSMAQALPTSAADSVSSGRNIPPTFTTEAFQDEASRLVLQEANQIAMQLNLPEKLPITEADVVRSYVGPLGYTYRRHKLGNATTSNYWYGVEQDYKFSKLTVAHYDEACAKLKRRGTVPIALMNTNAAYQLATQWMSAVSMDVVALNRECDAHVAVSPVWNGLAKLGDKPRKGSFVPIYYVWWTSRKNSVQDYGSVAAVELFLPSRTLIALSVHDSKYINRKPLVPKSLTDYLAETQAVTTIDTASQSRIVRSVPTELVERIAVADRIVAKHRESGFSLTVSGDRLSRILKAVSSAQRMELGSGAKGDCEIEFHIATNRLATIPFQGGLFLMGNAEYSDRTSELTTLHRELSNLIHAAQLNKEGDEYFAATNKAEARQWLKEPLHTVFKESKEVVRQFVEKFYAAGATGVFVSDLETPEGAQTQVTKGLIIVLPQDSATRRRVFSIEKERPNEWHEDPDGDVGQKYLFYEFF